MHNSNPPSSSQAELLELHNRLLTYDPVATEELFVIVAPQLERILRWQFPDLAPGVDPDIYVSAVYEALTNYFKDPGKYRPDKSGLMTYLRLASKRDMQNLLRKESRHAKGRVPLESVEFYKSDGNDISDEVVNRIDAQSLIEELERGMTPEERAVFSLMRQEERNTQVFAEAMNIAHLSFEQQTREVKRVKDRIKKRIKRRGSDRS